MDANWLDNLSCDGEAERYTAPAGSNPSSKTSGASSAQHIAHLA